MTDDLAPPQPGSKDIALGIARAAVSAIPVVGSPAVELLNLVIKAPIEQRRNAFLNDLAARLAGLERAGRVSLCDLVDDPVFADIVLQTTLAAIRTRHDIKHAALRNAALNSVLPGAPEENLKDLFITLIDRLGSWHITILTLLEQKTPPHKDLPQGSVTLRLNVGQHPKLSSLIDEFIPQLSGKRYLYSQFLNDLHAADLFASDGTRNLPMSEVPYTTVTPLGRQFLAFIRDPQASA